MSRGAIAASTLKAFSAVLTIDHELRHRLSAGDRVRSPREPPRRRARSTSRRPVRVGFMLTDFSARFAPGTSAPATTKNAALEISPGTCHSCGVSSDGARDRHAVAFPFDRHAARRQHALGVIAGQGWLFERSFPRRMKAGQEDAGLHLSARELAGPLNRDADPFAQKFSSARACPRPARSRRPSCAAVPRRGPSGGS